MKKILIFALLLISFCGIAQQTKELNVASMTASDTTLYLRNQHHNLFTIDFTTINASNSTVDVGLSDDGVSFVSADVTGVTWPVTLSKTTYTKTANGYTRNRFALMCENWPGLYIAVKIAKGSATTGVWKIVY